MSAFGWLYGRGQISQRTMIEQGYAMLTMVAPHMNLEALREIRRVLAINEG